MKNKQKCNIICCAGKRLKIYSDADINDLPETVSSNRPGSGSNVVGIRSHVVTSGESLYTIAQQYNTTISKIKKMNNIKDNKIIIGQELIIE